MGYRHHGVNTGGLPIDYIKRFVNAFNIKVFIETGTAGGDSVREAAKIFNICHTIEIIDGRPVGEFPTNVKLHNGDSAKLLKSIANEYKGEYIFFWLDAHWSDPDESKDGVNECPILAEIESIQGHRCIIMIDDARLFYGAPPWPCNPTKGWPRFMHVFQKLMTCFPNHIITIVDDYIIAFPDEARQVHFDEWRGRFNDRYPTEETLLKQAVKKAYQAFKNYIE